MCPKPGFFLIQTSIYIALFSLILALMLRATMQDIVAQTKNRTILARTAEINAALQRFVRDIHQAPAQIDEWQKRTKSHIVWQYSSESIGWFLDKGNLVRQHGTYDYKKKSWSKKIQNIAIRAIETVTFDLTIKENMIHAVIVTLEDGNNAKKYQRFISLRNRSL